MPEFPHVSSPSIQLEQIHSVKKEKVQEEGRRGKVGRMTTVAFIRLFNLLIMACSEDMNITQNVFLSEKINGDFICTVRLTGAVQQA